MEGLLDVFKASARWLLPLIFLFLGIGFCALTGVGNVFVLLFILGSFLAIGNWVGRMWDKAEGRENMD